MLEQAGLAGFIVIGCDVEQRVRAGVFGVLRQVDGGGSIVAAGTGDDLDAVIDLLHAVLYSGNVLTDRKCGTLASGAADTDGVYAAGDLLLNQGAERVVVDGAALVKGGHNGGTGAGKDGFSHN